MPILKNDHADDVWLSETGSRSWSTAAFMDLQHSIAPKMLIMDPEYHGVGGYVPLMFFHGCASLDSPVARIAKPIDQDLLRAAIHQAFEAPPAPARTKAPG